MSLTNRRRLKLKDADYSPDIQLRIRSKHPYFEADCQLGAYPFRFPIELSTDDMKDICHGLQAKLDALRLAFEDDGANKSERANALQSLAEEGHGALVKIFAPKGFRTKLEETLLETEQLVLQITSEEFSIPWDALYLRDPAKPPSFLYFWGMRHIVSRIIVLDPGDDTPPDHLIRARMPVLGLLTNKELDSLVEKEIPFFQARNEAKQIALRHLDKELDPENRRHFQHVKHFLNKRYHILHFACHADFVQGEGPKVVITREFDVSLKNLISYECNVQGNPVIFLNACRTSQMEPTYFSSLARHFFKSGARGLIATECEVPDDFAAFFSERVYMEFLNGNPLGECIFAAKRHFLSSADENPLGLLYSLYGPPSVRLVKESESNGST